VPRLIGAPTQTLPVQLVAASACPVSEPERSAPRFCPKARTFCRGKRAAPCCVCDESGALADLHAGPGTVEYGAYDAEGVEGAGFDVRDETVCYPV